MRNAQPSGAPNTINTPQIGWKPISLHTTPMHGHCSRVVTTRRGHRRQRRPTRQLPRGGTFWTNDGQAANDNLEGCYGGGALYVCPPIHQSPCLLRGTASKAHLNCSSIETCAQTQCMFHHFSFIVLLHATTFNATNS